MHASEGADGAPLDKGNPVIRPYIPISRPEHEGELVFIIKKYESGSSRRRALHQGSYPKVLLQRFAARRTPGFSKTPTLCNRERIRARHADRWRLLYHTALPTTRPCARGFHEPDAFYAALRERFRNRHTPARGAQRARARTPTYPVRRTHARQPSARLGRRVWIRQPRAYQDTCPASRDRREVQGVRLLCVSLSPYPAFFFCLVFVC